MSTILERSLDLLLEEQKSYLDYFYKMLDRTRAEAFIAACSQCKGLIILTGVGKSGIVAEKVAFTLISTGTRALFLPATNVLHGDLGIISAKDCVVMLSKSGETEELLDLAPHVRRRGARLLALVSSEQNRLKTLSDVALVLPVQRELCSFDLVPTTSAAVQLLFGDLLAMALMEQKGISLEQYALNHPSGSIGKKTTLQVKDLMIQGEGVPQCRPSDKLIDQIVQLSSKKCGCLIVIGEKEELLGIFTDGDLRRGLQKEGVQVLEKKMEEVMTSSPIITTPEMLAFDALKYMQRDPKRWVMVAPVVLDQKVEGVIRMHDIIHEGL